MKSEVRTADEYIKRSDALQAICGNCTSDPDEGICESLWGKCKDYKAIANIPAADAVEVVRCRDCKRWWYDATSELGVMFGYCENVKPRRLTTGSWFCADGERRAKNEQTD